MSIRSRTEKQIVVFPHNGISHHSENKHSTTLCNHRAECRVKEDQHKTTRVCVFIYTRLRSKRNRGMAGPVQAWASLGGEGGGVGGGVKGRSFQVLSLHQVQVTQRRVQFMKLIKLLAFAIWALACRYNTTLP